MVYDSIITIFWIVISIILASISTDIRFSYIYYQLLVGILFTSFYIARLLYQYYLNRNNIIKIVIYSVVIYIIIYISKKLILLYIIKKYSSITWFTAFGSTNKVSNTTVPTKIQK